MKKALCDARSKGCRTHRHAPDVPFGVPIDPVAPRRQRFPGAGERIEVAIEPDEARRARFEQRACVAAEPDGAVDEQSAVFGTEMLEDRGSHDRDV